MLICKSLIGSLWVFCVIRFVWCGEGFIVVIWVVYCKFSLVNSVVLLFGLVYRFSYCLVLLLIGVRVNVWVINWLFLFWISVWLLCIGVSCFGLLCGRYIVNGEY